MNFARSLFPVTIVCSAAALLPSGALAAPEVGLDVQDCINALQLISEGKYPEAIKLYEGIPQKYPTSGMIPESKFRLGYIYFVTGDYDKARSQFGLTIATKGVTPDIVELCYSFIPQVQAAKASKLQPDDPGRKAAFLGIVKEFDNFIQKYPQSEEVESANYGKARALFSIGEYEDSAKSLKVNLVKFPASPSLLDTEFMLALTLGTQANNMMQKAAGKPSSMATALYEESSRYFVDIIGKRTDLALGNEAQFQLGEMLSIRANFENDTEAKEAFGKRALSAYKAVLTKDMVIKVQQDRIAYVKQQLAKPNDPLQFRRLQRFLEKEQEKSLTIKNRPDQTVTSKLKCAQIYLTMQRFNECRVLLRYIEPIVTDPDQKKQVAYFMTVTYAGQENTEKGVEFYDKFMSAYKGDPIGENLPILLASAFTAQNKPEKAQKYFDEQRQLYPKSTLTGDSVMRQALSLIPLERYDEALEILKKFLAGSPPKQQSASAELGIATIYQKTEKLNEALKAFTGIRDKYKDSQEAEQAGYWVGQIAYAKGDYKTAISESKTFLNRNPKSDLVPAALFIQGQAQAALGQKVEALASFRELSTTYPKSEAAPAAYFQRAALHQKDKELDEVKAAMKEFVEAYPDSDRVFSSYDYIAQVQASQKAPMDAIATYEDFIAKRPTHADASKALVKISSIWKKYAEDLGTLPSLKEDQKVEWHKGIDGCLASAEKVLEKYPESAEVSLALQNLLGCQKLLMRYKQITEKQLDDYFQGFARKFEGKAVTKNKVLFTLAGYAGEKDPAKAFGIMKTAYDEKLVYAPVDLDVYGNSLLKAKQVEAAQKVFEKLANDYPLPPNTAPEKAPRLIADAQSFALYGAARVLQAQGKKAESAAKFELLKTTYPFSSKLLEAEFGIAEGEVLEKKYEEALKRLQKVAGSSLATPNLRARSMMLVGEIAEQRKDFDTAINQFVKVGTLFPGETELAPEGLLRGAQLLEKKINK